MFKMINLIVHNWLNLRHQKLSIVQYSKPYHNSVFWKSFRLISSTIRIGMLRALTKTFPDK